jgi:hypothetical protein
MEDQEQRAGTAICKAVMGMLSKAGKGKILMLRNSSAYKLLPLCRNLVTSTEKKHRFTFKSLLPRKPPETTQRGQSKPWQMSRSALSGEGGWWW